MKNFVKIAFFAGLSSLMIIACVQKQKQASPEMNQEKPQTTRSVKAISDSEISLRKTSVFEIEEVPLFVSTAKDPEENDLLPRAFDGAPPQISHLVTDININRSENGCTDCHLSEKQKKKEDVEPAISMSHFSDEAGEKLIGERYFCMQCHVPQLDAMPLVENQFSKN